MTRPFATELSPSHRQARRGRIEGSPSNASNVNVNVLYEVLSADASLTALSRVCANRRCTSGPRESHFSSSRKLATEVDPRRHAREVAAAARAVPDGDAVDVVIDGSACAR